MSMFRLDGQVALVTGASQGIGIEIARRLSERGAKVVVAARSTDRLEELVAELTTADAHALTLDLSEAEAIPEAIKQLPEEFAAIDILVNNAGITADQLLARMTLDKWESVLRTNLTGAYAVTRAVTRGMVRRRFGRVISISSVVGLMGNAGQANYAAAKAGLVGFSKSLARELASRNITVNVVAPGYIKTAMTADLTEAARSRLFESIPLGRMGSGQDVANAVLFLASQEAGYVTGHVLNVSGGLYI